MKRKNVYGYSSVGALIAAMGFPSPSYAQSQNAEASSTANVESGEGASPENQAIVITGSRIVRRDYDSSSPIVTINRDQLQNNSSPTIEVGLQQLPQFAPIAPVAARATLNLRNLGANRNLVLLDGRRMQPSAADFSVDINSLPASIVENVEVISGGASAVYGSDAVSGVVNFKLRRRFQGLAVSSQMSISEKGDSKSYNANAIVGGNFAGDLGNAYFAVDYTNREGVINSEREFYQNAYQNGSGSVLPFLPQGYFKATTNAPTQAAIDSYFQGIDSSYVAGSVRPSALFAFNNSDGSIFNQSGAKIYNFDGASPPRTAVVTNAAGQSVVYNGGSETYLQAPLERWSMFGRGEFNISDDITAYAQGGYTSTTVGGRVNPSNADNFWLLRIPRDAAHPVPDSLAALLDSRADPTAAWEYGRQVSFVGPIQTDNRTDIFHVVVGLKGRIPSTDWTWDIYGQHGQTNVIARITEGGVRATRLQELMSAPLYGKEYVSPSVGRVVCTSGVMPFGETNSSLATPNANSDPINVAGQNFSRMISQDCIDFISARTKNTTSLGQDIVEANMQGTLVDLPGGRMGFSVGMSYRRNSYSFSPDSLFEPKSDSSSDIMNNFGALPTSGSSDVKEIYGELLIPILSDIPFFRSLELDVAARYSDYQQAGGVWAYKADATWKPIDSLLLRGGYQRAVRAPNVNELFAPQTNVLSTGAAAVDPCITNAPVAYGNNVANPNQAKVQALCRALIPSSVPYDPTNYAGAGAPSLVGSSSGNANLSPEKADTYTAGAVFRPAWTLPLEGRVSLSVDYYNISINGAIAVLNPLESYQLCFNQNGSSNPDYSSTNAYCAPIIRAPSNGFPSNVQNVYMNLGGLKTSGIDVQADLSATALGGRVALNFVGSYLDSYKRAVNPTAPFIEQADTTGGFFRFRGNTSLSYSAAAYSIGLRWRHFDSVHDVSYQTNKNTMVQGVPAYDIFDGFATFNVDKVSFRAGIDNLFNRSPAFVGLAANQIQNGFTDPAYYDVLGRRFYFNASLKF